MNKLFELVEKPCVLAVMLMSTVFLLSLEDVSLAESVRLTTIVPDKETVRTKRGVVGDPPAGTWSGGYTYRDLPNGTIGDDNLIVGGRVGIGTTSPAEELHINGDLRLEGGNDGPQIEWRTGSTRHWNIDQYADSLRFFTEDSADNQNGQTRVTITEAGRVGIGRGSPQELLDVNGAIRIGANANANAGTIRWTGTRFEGYNGSSWIPLGSMSFGTRVTRSTGLWYGPVTNDGFVCALISADSSGAYGYIVGYTDDDSDHLTGSIARAGAAVDDTTGSHTNKSSFTMPVRMGEYWVIAPGSSSGTVTTTVYWIPIE